MTFIFSLLFSVPAFGISNQMTQFEYTSCFKSNCVIVHAAKAYIGASQDNFTTTNPTELRLLNGSGRPPMIFKGESASYNPSIQSLVLELPNGGFLLYSMKDGKISDFRAGTIK